MVDEVGVVVEVLAGFIGGRALITAQFALVGLGADLVGGLQGASANDAGALMAIQSSAAGSAGAWKQREAARSFSGTWTRSRTMWIVTQRRLASAWIRSSWWRAPS
ncbi:hypothetical protein [Streptomyces alboflavus]|uniref:hypothetical protein n=1 Tax=Streptomyces alboflavus TaxID=67267 RepID=UPI0036847D5F